MKTSIIQQQIDRTQTFTLSQHDHPSTDTHWVLSDTNCQPKGHCSLWWNNTPPYQHHRVGLIGNYAAQTPEAARYLLHHACQHLKTQGCTVVIAPMDGSSWQHYRLISERGDEPLFFLEPDYPDAAIEQFIDQEFTAIAHYHSALNTDLTYRDQRSHLIRQKLQAIGVHIRPLDLTHLEEELHHLYPVITTCFRHNLLYKPISEADFIAQYRALLPYVNPELVLLAEHQHRLVGFLFAIPNLLEQQRGEAVQTVILKTIAVLPLRSYAGLGQILFEECHAIAHQMGFRRAIYALIHDASLCRNLTRRYARIIRRYALFAKPL
jgi:GNAT superfamily N-acetyltransferase